MLSDSDLLFSSAFSISYAFITTIVPVTMPDNHPTIVIIHNSKVISYLISRYDPHTMVTTAIIPNNANPMFLCFVAKGYLNCGRLESNMPISTPVIYLWIFCRISYAYHCISQAHCRIICEFCSNFVTDSRGCFYNG